MMIALVWGGTLNSSAANLRTAVKGAASGTLNLRDLRETLRESANQNQRVKEEERNMKKGLVWFYEQFERELWIGGERHFEGDLSSTTTTSTTAARHFCELNRIVYYHYALCSFFV